MESRLKTVRGYFAVRPEPYAGADMANAQRLGSLLWGLFLFLIVFLWIPSPPNEAIGEAGWALAGLIAAVAAVVVVGMSRRLWFTTWGRMLAISYGAVAAVAVLQWLAGGVGSPYERVFLLPILYVAMLHPPRRIFPFLGFVLLALTAPLVYGGWNSDVAGSVFAGFVIWSILAVLGNVLMTGVRAQRVALARDEADAREEARVDKLTGLHNRRGFDELLGLEVERSRRTGAPLSVAMIDLHSFKEINDQWGHAEGDRCLREVAAAIGAAVRRPELCFRWGGDEFAVILAGSSAEDVAPLGVRLSNVVDRECSRPDHTPMEITFAVAQLGPDMDAQELNEMAGMALTAAKSRSGQPASDPQD